jgi:hypothetical protein
VTVTATEGHDAAPFPALTGPAPGPQAGRIWFDNELLLWWIQGTRLPPLVSTSPPGTPTASAGVLGTPNAVSIYGPGSQDNNLRMGYRLTLGGYLDAAEKYALEAQFFMAANGGNQFNAASPGTPILARPVIDAATGLFVAEPIAVPGVANGSIHIATRTTGMLGAGIWLRENFTRSDDPCDTCHHCNFGCPSCGGCGTGSKWFCRFDSLFGYRYMRYSDNLEIDDEVNTLVALNGLPAGSSLQRSDQFHASNTFHGIDLGVTGEASRGPWTIGTTAKVAVGFNNESADIYGAHILNGVGGIGGLLAQSTNIGHQTHTLASAIPELDLKLFYSFTPNAKVYVGYSFLYWYHVARASNQVNPILDPAFLANSAPVGLLARQPAPFFEDRSIWMQALSVGFEWRY